MTDENVPNVPAAQDYSDHERFVDPQTGESFPTQLPPERRPAEAAVHLDEFGNRIPPNALFSHLFAKPLSDLTRPALENQLKVVAVVVDKLSQSEPHAALKKAHEKPLREALGQGEAALKERTKLQGTAAELTRRVDVLWEDANTALHGVLGGLQTLAAKRKLGREWVDSFFPDLPTRPKKPVKPATP